ncbi:MAG: hypothetical protein RLZZ623_3311, partial [Actinomycetota bacterium]
MTSEQIAGLELERDHAGMLVIRLARAERRNAIDVATAEALADLLIRATTD